MKTVIVHNSEWEMYELEVNVPNIIGWGSHAHKRL